MSVSGIRGPVPASFRMSLRSSWLRFSRQFFSRYPVLKIHHTSPMQMARKASVMPRLKPTLTSETQELVEAGDVALYISRWSLRGTDPAGKPVTMAGESADILRRQEDGRWLIALDNPWGARILASRG